MSNADIELGDSDLRVIHDLDAVYAPLRTAVKSCGQGHPLWGELVHEALAVDLAPRAFF